MSDADDTQPQLTPTLARRVAELVAIVGELEPGALPRIARLLVEWRAADYGAGRDGKSLSQTMAAVRPPKAVT